jgi:hypothetical protein
MLSPTASDVRVFVPAKDFSISKAFYKALGWKLNWEDAELAEMEIADRRFLLQNYYKKEWADNLMIHVSIDDVFPLNVARGGRELFHPKSPLLQRQLCRSRRLHRS